MTDINDPTNLQPAPAAPPPERKRPRWGKVLIVAGVVLASGFIGFGIGRYMAFQRFAYVMGIGHGSDKAAGRAEFMTNRLLSRIDATAEQKEKITAIVRNAMTELQPLRERHRAARIELTNALAAPTVDRARIEQMRTAELATAETLTRKMADYLASAAEVLTPAQRQQLAERMKERRRWRQG